MTATIKMKAGSRKWNPRPTDNSELLATLRKQKARHKHDEERGWLLKIYHADGPCNLGEMASQRRDPHFHQEIPILLWFIVSHTKCPHILLGNGQPFSQRDSHISRKMRTLGFHPVSNIGTRVPTFLGIWEPWVPNFPGCPNIYMTQFLDFYLCNSLLAFHWNEMGSLTWRMPL